MNELIQWPKAEYWDKPWNPVIGCKKISEGCENCYAARTMERFGQSFEPHLSMRQTPPKSGVVFVGNMTDLFGPWNSNEQILEWLKLLSPDANNLILTKRGHALSDFFWSKVWQPGIGDVAPHILLGITGESQARLEERILPLLNIPARRWLSLEPLLGPIDLSIDMNFEHEENDGYGVPAIKGIDWVVVGAESGPNRRPCKLEWVESIVRQCREADVKVFIKQLDLGGREVERDINKFPEHLRIRLVPWAKGGVKC